MQDRRLPIAALIVAALLFGLTFVVIKQALSDFPPLAFVAWRFAAGAAVLGVLSFPTKSRIWRDGAIAGAWLFAGFGFQTVGLQHTEATNSALITGLYVVFTPLLVAAWTRTRLAPWVVVGVVMAFIGLVLVAVDDTFAAGLGDLLTIVSALGFAGHIVYLSKSAMRHPLVPFVAVQLATTSLLAFVLSAVIEGPTLPSGPVLSAVIGTGVGVSAAAFLLQIWAQTRIGPTRTATILTLEPVFGVLAGAVLLGERLDPRGWLGAVVIVAAIQVVMAHEPDEGLREAEAISPAH